MVSGSDFPLNQSIDYPKTPSSSSKIAPGMAPSSAWFSPRENPNALNSDWLVVQCAHLEKSWSSSMGLG